MKVKPQVNVRDDAWNNPNASDIYETALVLQKSS